VLKAAENGEVEENRFIRFEKLLNFLSYSYQIREDVSYHISEKGFEWHAEEKRIRESNGIFGLILRK
jgi:hypothetical protein